MMTNTLSLPRTGKLAILASALVYTGAMLGVATGAAPVEAAGAPFYTAKLAAPASDVRAVADGVAWACKDETCVANKTSARPLRVCRGLNRKFGEVAEFKVNGELLAADELAKCNG
ncbi:CC_3452 family protein [Erythrobacter sp. NE805]|uniref:CC_3452 family protein n=1 Tax=Erythrobacter sp. NE805 TaxID=3389875 RepID=UPI00396B1937